MFKDCNCCLDFTIDESLDMDFAIGDRTIIEVKDYEKLENLPYINDIEIIGRKTGADYRLQNKMDALTVQEIERILYL